MERYGGAHFVEAGQLDHVAEWAVFGGETGLEEPMWQLGLGGGSESYPERPDEADCIYYLKTGFCGYGPRCRFNHPYDSGAYYMQTGIRKFGAAGKYDHPKHRIESSTAVTLNFYGYPLQEVRVKRIVHIILKWGNASSASLVSFIIRHLLQVPAQLSVPGSLAAPPGLPRTTVFPLARSPIQSS